MRRYLPKLALHREILVICFTCLFKNSRWACRTRKNACISIGRRLNISLELTAIKWVGLAGIAVQGLELRYKDQCWLRVAYLEVVPDLRALFRGKRALSSLRATGVECGVKVSRPAGTAAATQQASGAPLDRLTPRRYRMLFRLFDLFFAYMPAHFCMDTLRLSICFREREYTVGLRNPVLKNERYSATVETNTAGIRPFLVEGRLEKEQGLFTVDHVESIDRANGFSFSVPGISCYFRGKSAAIKVMRQAQHRLSITFFLEDCNLFWPPLASNDVPIPLFEMNLDACLTAEGFALERTSTIRYNGIDAGLFIEHCFSDQAFTMVLSLKKVAMNTLLRSFPLFICKKLYDLRCLGAVLMEIRFGFMISNPVCYFLEIDIDGREVEVLNYPSPLLPSLEGPFTHQVYDKGKFLRSIAVDRDNSQFVPMEDIPDLLSFILVYTEDPHFYEHWGVDEVALGYSMIRNMINRKFERGGSTITMQLARNLYLGHSKTMLRKGEEILLTYLLEQVFRVPKKRILEIYFNIIEFAEGVYGIKAACEYYFGKAPCDLNLVECIVLSYIVPRPKYFMEAFLSASEKLVNNLNAHIHRVSEALVMRGVLPAESLQALGQGIHIRGKTLVLPEGMPG